MDIIFLDGKKVLHIVDTSTRVSVAKLLYINDNNSGKSVEGIWLEFIKIWCKM